MLQQLRKLPVLLLLILAAGAGGWWFFARGEEKVSYLTETVRRGNVTQTVSAVGEINAIQLVDVGAQVGGQITGLYVQLGQTVNKGDAIADIDSTTKENELKTNQARLKTYQAQLAAKRITRKIAGARYERERGLKRNDATSQQNLEEAERNLALADAEIDEINSLIVQAEIAVSTAQINLDYAKIVSPLDGVVVSVPVEAGQTVNANQTTPTIVQIADLEQMEISIQISEGDITKVKPGMNVSYGILSVPDSSFTAVLKSIDPGPTTLTDGSYKKSTSGAASSGSSAAAVYYYGKLVAPNPEGKLRIGMTTQSTITIAAAKDVLLVPSVAVQKRGRRQFVDVLEASGEVTRKEIVTGISDSMNVEVVSGLAEGEQVISSQMSQTEIKGAINTRLRGPRF
ncbi:MAG: efflux RND transporter periplasmic adaptor subunit [Deltaproteobacteria bacterium]|jgi:macrolide-specific efflux system membrane fusion protein|nr:efflux RND transporter periplasmic adaptor subunit [Deltaproteobacteria bacterium]